MDGWGNKLTTADAARECVSYARLATDERQTGRVGIVAIGVPSAESSSMDALG